MKKIMLVTNGSGYQIDKCLSFDFFFKTVDIVVSDRYCPALDVAKHHNISCVNFDDQKSESLNKKILDLARERKIDYIISPGFTRLFKGDLLEEYKNKLFNCHPSILPAFKGFYDTRDTRRKYHARKIFERTIDFGSRVTGNTIHLINQEVDEGYPIIVSTMNIPYNEEIKFTRHRLFVQECKCLLQFVSWLDQERLVIDSDGLPYIKNGKYDESSFSPNIEDTDIKNFELSYPY